MKIISPQLVKNLIYEMEDTILEEMNAQEKLEDNKKSIFEWVDYFCIRLVDEIELESEDPIIEIKLTK